MAIKQITAQSTDRMTCLVIGGYGKGKTSLLRTIPEKDNVLVISAESGLLCVRDLVQSGRITGFEIETFEDIFEIFKIIKTDEYKKKYKWIFIDSLTEIADKCADSGKIRHPNTKDALKMWGEYGERMKRLVKSFRDLDHYNVVFTSLDSAESDDTGHRYIGPQMQGQKFKEKLPSLFDEVFYLTILKDENGENKRKLITQPVDNMPAKDRSGKLDLIEEPDLSVISAKIMTAGKINLNSKKMTQE